MIDREKVIRAVDSCFNYWLVQHRCLHPLELENVQQLKADAIALLKEQEPREITKDEWESWKKAKHRDPLCMYWRGDVMPFWILKPEEVHEPAYLIGDIKIFNGKPDKEKMHEIWLNDCK